MAVEGGTSAPLACMGSTHVLGRTIYLLICFVVVVVVVVILKDNLGN